MGSVVIPDAGRGRNESFNNAATRGRATGVWIRVARWDRRSRNCSNRHRGIVWQLRMSERDKQRPDQGLSESAQGCPNRTTPLDHDQSHAIGIVSAVSGVSITVALRIQRSRDQPSNYSGSGSTINYVGGCPDRSPAVLPGPWFWIRQADSL